ncbi:PREDICTED: protein FAM170A [Propithecus coquereli]|uniref:Family with sequence similarity 170 member A n=1 Tax=Propithecus coquereli TaxID=379532 RepID=A0A2K6GLL3_PROCO|nr:PREDICTED: protein FAM170A [Propithecus coquereli]
MKRRQKRKHLENEESQETEKGGGISKLQEDAPQPGCTGVARGQSLGVGEFSSTSEYFSCVSSPSKLIHGGIRRLHQDSPQPRSPLAQVQERGETLPRSHVSLSSCFSYKTCVSSLCVHKEGRGMKIYYMQVQMRKGVAVSWETEETSESLEKQPRMEEVTLPEDVRVGTPPSDVSTRNLPSDSEPSGEEKEHEERAESDSLPGSPAVEERPRARTPDWLVTMENGFRCMACCRVFATTELLQEHVQHGIREGFSCHVFHLTMAQLTGNVESESTREEEEDEGEEEEEEKQEEKEDEGEQPTREDLGLRRPWSQCPGCVFHSPKDRNN